MTASNIVMSNSKQDAYKLCHYYIVTHVLNTQRRSAVTPLYAQTRTRYDFVFEADIGNYDFNDLILFRRECELAGSFHVTLLREKKKMREKKDVCCLVTR